MMGIDLSLLSFCQRACMAFPGRLFLRVGNASGSEVRFFHCKWKSRTECCQCPNGRPLCVGASMGACMTVCFKVHFPQGFALPNLLCSMHACLCKQQIANRQRSVSQGRRVENTKADVAPTAAWVRSLADTRMTKCTQTLVWLQCLCCGASVRFALTLGMFISDCCSRCEFKPSALLSLCVPASTCVFVVHPCPQASRFLKQAPSVKHTTVSMNVHTHTCMHSHTQWFTSNFEGPLH